MKIKETKSQSVGGGGFVTSSALGPVAQNLYELRLPPTAPEMQSEVLRQPTNNTRERQDCESRLLQKEDIPFWAHLDVLAATENDGTAALERIEQAERFARGTLDAISASLAILDANGVILAVNQSWRRIAQVHGRGSDNLCEGTNYLTVCDAASGAISEGAHEMAAGIRCVIQGLKDEFMLEYPCHSPNERRWFRSSVTRFQGTGPIRVVALHEDISARKRADLARDEAQALLQNIASRVPGMVFQYHLRVDGSSYFPYASESIRAIYRVSPQHAFANAAAVFAVVHPDDHDAVVIALQQSAADITPWVLEYRVKFDDGTVRWLLGNALPHRQADGCTLWHGFITDITERKVSEALMTEKSMQLLFQNEEKEKRAAELVVANKELVFQNDEKEKRAAELVVANKELVFQSDEKGKRAAELVVANKELVFQNDEKEKRAAELVVANKELVFQYEEKHKRAAELSQALDDAEAAISERKQNEKKMETLHDEMNSMLVWQVAQHTVAALAHEINQPLASLSILSEVAKRLLVSDQISDGNHGERLRRREETLMRMNTEIERAASVVRSLLISVNKPDITRASALVNELIGESIRTAQSEGVFGYAIMANYAADLPLVNVNRLQVSKVLLNLIHNSAQAMHAAQTPNGKIVLSTAVTDDGSEVSISVQDDGPGISALMQQEIFQPFITTKSHGLGLGLTISRALIEANGGKLWATQTKGQGATFHFTLPTAG